MKPYYQDEAVTIYHGDCRTIVPLIAGDHVMVSDPPTALNISRVISEFWRDLLSVTKIRAFGMKSSRCGGRDRPWFLGHGK